MARAPPASSPDPTPSPPLSFPCPSPLEPLLEPPQVDDETLALLKDQFSALDADGSGELDADDIDMLTNACEVLEQEDKVGAPSSARIGAMSPAAAVSLTGKRSPGMALVAAPVASKPA